MGYNDDSVVKVDQEFFEPFNSRQVKVVGRLIQKKNVWITKPAIVLADEPTGNLDSKTSAEVLGLIKRTSAEFRQTVVMITHNNDIARLADRIVRIEDGKIVE